MTQSEIRNKITSLEIKLQNLTYDNNGNAIDREAAHKLSTELDELEEQLFLA